MGSNNNSGGKKRVYELARDLGLEDSKPLIRILRGMGYPVSTPSNGIPDDAVKKINETVAPHIEQMRREALAKKDKAAQKQTPSPVQPRKRTIRIAKRATEEEKLALIEERKKQQEAKETEAAAPAERMVRVRVPARQLSIEQAAPGQTAASTAADATATAAATPGESTAAGSKVAQQASQPAGQVSAVSTQTVAGAEKTSLPGDDASAKEADKRKPSRHDDFHDTDDEENDKASVDLPGITLEDLGLVDDVTTQLSAPAGAIVPISPAEAFGSTSLSASGSFGTKPHKDRGADRSMPYSGPRPGAGPSRPGSGPSRPGAAPGRPGAAAGLRADHGANRGRPGQMGGRPGQPGVRPGQPGARPGQAGVRPGQPGGRPGQMGGRPGAGRFGGQAGQQRSKGRKGHVGDRHAAPAAPVSKAIEIPEVIALSELASRLSRPASEIIKYLISQGRMVTINQALSYDEASELATVFGFEVSGKADENIPLELIEDQDEGHLTTRPPVVTVLGHVDHGKTSLLDAIRETSVTSGEAGGITQKIGAYTVNHRDRCITFIDTPGHEAFTQMRARGASITDIAILVVAANDGVMPQTIEAINHAKAANVPILVAINKIDLPEASPERVISQLTEYGLVAEEWGGDTIVSQVSAKKRIGLEDLLEMILLVADMRDLKANADRRAQGTIIEGWLDRGMGPVATVLVQNGTLHSGDIVVVGKTWGRVRGLLNEKGGRIRSAGPSIPAEIIGLTDVPNAGDYLQAVEDEKMAKQVSEARTAKDRHARITAGSKQTLESLFNEMKEGVAKDLNLLVKADGHGSMEALNQSLNRLTTSEVAVKIVHSGVGAISESDIMLASASGATVIGFNVRPDSVVKRLADQEQVDIRIYRVIYHVIEDIKKAMSGLLAPDIEEVNVGRVEVRQVFKTSKAGKVAGCYVVEGKVIRDGLARLLRDSKVIYEGSIDTLKRFKDDAREVTEGYECGLTLTNYQDVQENDIVEVYQKVEHNREI